MIYRRPETMHSDATAFTPSCRQASILEVQGAAAIKYQNISTSSRGFGKFRPLGRRLDSPLCMPVFERQERQYASTFATLYRYIYLWIREFVSYNSF